MDKIEKDDKVILPLLRWAIHQIPDCIHFDRDSLSLSQMELLYPGFRAFQRSSLVIPHIVAPFADSCWSKQPPRDIAQARPVLLDWSPGCFYMRELQKASITSGCLTWEGKQMTSLQERQDLLEQTHSHSYNRHDIGKKIIIIIGPILFTVVKLNNNFRTKYCTTITFSSILVATFSGVDHLFSCTAIEKQCLIFTG